MFFTKEDREAVKENTKAVKENTKDIKDLDAVLCKNLKLIDAMLPRINLLEMHVKSLLSKNEDMSAKMYELATRGDWHRFSEITDDEKEGKPKNKIHKYGTKKDGTPAKKRGRKPTKKNMVSK